MLTTKKLASSNFETTTLRGKRVRLERKSLIWIYLQQLTAKPPTFTYFPSLKFIRLLRVVFSSQQGSNNDSKKSDEIQANTAHVYLKTWWEPQIRQDRRKWISELKERNENACACLVHLSLNFHFNCFVLILPRLRSICLLIDGKIGVTKNDLIAFEMMGEIAAPFQVNTLCSAAQTHFHYTII